MNDHILGGLTVRELAAETWRKTNEDGVFGRAAELAYYFLLALFPMLIFLTSLVGFMPGVRESIFKALANFLPGEAMTLVSQTISDVTRNRSSSLVSFGVFGALLTAFYMTRMLVVSFLVIFTINRIQRWAQTRGVAVQV